MMEHAASLGLALGIFSAGFLVIGPNILAVMGTSMAQGRHAGCALALGVGIGSGLWASLTVVGLAALVSTYANLMIALKLFGAAYLTWMAVRAFRSALVPHGTPEATAEPQGNMVLRGLAIQMTNPKAALQWIAIVSIGIGPDAPWALGAALIVSATLLSLLGHLAYATAFSTAPVIRLYARARRWIEGALGVFFLFASVKLATAKV